VLSVFAISTNQSDESKVVVFCATARYIKRGRGRGRVEG